MVIALGVRMKGEGPQGQRGGERRGEGAGGRAGWKEGQRASEREREGREGEREGERPSDISREEGRERETAEGNTQLGLQNNRKARLCPDSIMHTTHSSNMVPLKS